MDKIFKMNKIKKEYVPFVYFFVLVLGLYLQCKIRYGTDDTWHIETIKNIGVLKWVYVRATTWQPRIFSDLMFATINFNMRVWSVYSAILSTGTLFMASKIATVNIEDEEILKKCNIFLCAIYFCIYPFLINSTTFWYAGSFYYVLPMFFFLIAIYPYVLMLHNKNLEYKASVYFLFFATMIISYTEQTLLIGVVLLGCMLLYARIKKLKINTHLVVNYFFLIINSVIFVSINFSAGRLGKEMHWYPDFPMLSTIDKIFQGINWTNYYYINSSNFIFTVFIMLLTLNIYILNKKQFSKLYLLPAIYMIINMLPLDALFKNINVNNFRGTEYLGEISSFLFGSGKFNYLYNTMLAGPDNVNTSLKYLAPSFFGVLIIFTVVGMIIMAKKDSGDAIFMSLLYLAAIFSGYIMLISPTIFASGTRIFYIGTILILILTTNLFSEACVNMNIKKTAYINYAIIFVAIPMYLQLFFAVTRMGGIL